MDISREQEIQFRRDRVLELSSKGLTQQEIAVQLKYTQQTNSNDLKYLQKKDIESLGRQAEQVAADYQQVLSNLYSIRKEASVQWTALRVSKFTRMDFPYDC